MWYLWTAILVASSALVVVEGGAAARAEAPAPATTRAPSHTLDRQAAEQAWRVWLQSPESGNPNAPPRRITTKSLFITPLVCPKGQRLDSNGCIQTVSVPKSDHERILLEQLNAVYASSPSVDVVYDYGDEEPGPLQLSIPIALDPLAERLQAQEPSAQAQQQHPTYVKPDKKNDVNADSAAGLVAELELLQLQHSQNTPNDTTSAETSDILNHNVLQSVDKPKRDSPVINSTEVETEFSESEKGQKEVVYGHVNIDPVLYNTEIDTETTTTEANTEIPTTETPFIEANETVSNNSNDLNNKSVLNLVNNPKNSTTAVIKTNITLKKDADRNKLNPENDYADIGEAIKLISRYAEVTTDDNFSKDQNKFAVKDDSILGTRTKLQYRRNKPKPAAVPHESLQPQIPLGYTQDHKPEPQKINVYYRYPWQGQHSPTPPPDYPFHHIQDYWPKRNQIGGVYNIAHENPRRHHHMYPQNYYRSHNLPYANYPGVYPGQQGFPVQVQPYPHRLAQHHLRPIRSHGTNQDLYTLLGLRHWFSSEGTSKR